MVNFMENNLSLCLEVKIFSVTISLFFASAIYRYAGFIVVCSVIKIGSSYASFPRGDMGKETSCHPTLACANTDRTQNFRAEKTHETHWRLLMAIEFFPVRGCAVFLAIFLSSVFWRTLSCSSRACTRTRPYPFLGAVSVVVLVPAPVVVVVIVVAASLCGTIALTAFAICPRITDTGPSSFFFGLIL